jgi:hypothetical protein
MTTAIGPGSLAWKVLRDLVPILHTCACAKTCAEARAGAPRVEECMDPNEGSAATGARGREPLNPPKVQTADPLCGASILAHGGHCVTHAHASANRVRVSILVIVS